MSTQPSRSGSSSVSPHPMTSSQTLQGITSSLSKPQMNRMIMEYLIQQGYPRAAADFAKESGLPLNSEINTLEQRRKIKLAIYAGRLQEAIEEINEIDASILEHDQDLHFQLLNLQLIEIIKEENAKPELDIHRCVDFARENLAPRAPTKESWRKQLERTMSLMFFSADKVQAELQMVISPESRVEVAKSANEAILRATGEQPVSGLTELLQTRVFAEDEAKSLKRWPDGGMDIGLGPKQSSDALMGHGGLMESSAPEEVMQDM